MLQFVLPYMAFIHMDTFMYLHGIYLWRGIQNLVWYLTLWKGTKGWVSGIEERLTFYCLNQEDVLVN